MAYFIRPYATVTLRDGIGRESVWQAYVSQGTAQAYAAAADASARAATALGVLFTKLAAVTDMEVVSKGIGYMEINDAPGDPADSVLRGNKLQFFFNGSGRSFTMSVPGRKASAYEQQANSLQIALDSPTAMSDFIDAFNTNAKDINGSSVTITSAQVVD